jgi:DNA adenine methylase
MIMTIQNKIKIPFSWFGGKQKVAKIIWAGLGKVDNYVEPFAGSLSVLLNNPSPAKIETVNDLDCGLVNFWRAVSRNPEGVAQYADFPVNETEVHARHNWLISVINDDFRKQMDTNPDFYDIKVAGYWVYGQCASVGNNWLQPKGLRALPVLSSAGGGIHGLTYSIYDDFKILRDRLRRVRVACGDWSRVVTPGITYASKGLSPKDITAVFLDPPYDVKVRDKVYKEDTDVFHEVCKWAIENGNNPRMRIVLCGYEGDHGIPDTWQIIPWKTGGGMSALGNDRGKENVSKERLWLSPHCLQVTESI